MLAEKNLCLSGGGGGTHGQKDRRVANGNSTSKRKGPKIEG